MFNKRTRTDEDTKKALEERRVKYLGYTPYVTDEAARKEMLRGLSRALVLINSKEYEKAASHLENVKHHFVIARYSNKVLKYKTDFGGWLSILWLVIFAAAFYWGTQVFSDDSFSYKALVSLVGGGLGGVTLVIFGIIGIEIQTSAVIHRSVWYIFKPISGAIMGLVTYLAVLLGTAVLSTPVDNIQSIFFISFLGGFLESFFQKVLSQAASIQTTTPGTKDKS